jgi:hypothetical protein
MKIYVAAMYGQMMEMRDVRDRLVAAGHEVTAQWIDGKEANDTQSAAAIMDVQDVVRAEALIAFSQARGTMHTGGGRHVEFGIALALGKRLMVVGPRGEHVFHAYPGVRFFDTLDDAIGAL